MTMLTKEIEIAGFQKMMSPTSLINEVSDHFRFLNGKINIKNNEINVNLIKYLNNYINKHKNPPVLNNNFLCNFFNY